MASCNGCAYDRLKKKLGDKFLLHPENNTIYKLDSEPHEGQSEPLSYEGRPIEFIMWGMSYGHCDDEDCELTWDQETRDFVNKERGL